MESYHLIQFFWKFTRIFRENLAHNIEKSRMSPSRIKGPVGGAPEAGGFIKYVGEKSTETINI